MIANNRSSLIKFQSMRYRDFFKLEEGQTMLAILEKSDNPPDTLQKANNAIQARAAQTGRKVSCRKVLIVDERSHEINQALYITLV